ncbi:putative E3 ubiquitin-protein ligase RING1a isoform X1 [Actinidia eriantha]|uniref:putative E3 ubiquitin-protein ligase RING1a isoform X1 n=1 Tax=Actinidia eriantha TaxID=165200 RepID=UPI00258846CA|nr:putative E3 ubiquitin-protein ligase RING1a isoform X1 [Actinidia eriantha]
MPAQKRQSSSENQNHPLPDDDSPQHHGRRKQPRRERRPEQGRQRSEEDEDEDEYDDDEDEEEDPEGEDSDESRSSDDPTKLSEWVFVQLQTLRTCVQCPICLGIIKKTRTVMECLHRFCRACIDKSMRLGNNECPACRKHCASRRSLRDDPEFDALIEILYDDIEKYEEEELAFHEEEKTRNNQIQASIAQILQRQSEALVTRAKRGKDTASACTARLPRNDVSAYSRRRRRNNRGTGSDDNEDANNHDGDKDSSSTDERGTEIKQRRYKRRGGAQSSQPSPSVANSDGGAIENDLEASRENRGTASGPVRNPEMLAWGGGGARSKSVRNTRIMKLTKYLENLKENDDKLDVYLMLIPLDKQRMPSLQRLYYCFPPRFSVECLKEYVAHEIQLRTEDIEIILVKKLSSTDGLQSILEPSTSIDNNVVQILEGPETLAELGANCSSNRKHLILAYRLKPEGERQGSSS